MTNWSGKNWFITGASTGFGRHLAEAILERGGRVIATARNPETLDDLVRQSEGRAINLPLDVTKADQVAAAVRDAEAFGGIDVLVNNAGYGFMGGVEESSDDEINAQFDVNFFGALRVIRHALPGMRARSAGFIVNLSSIAGVHGFLGSGYYSATKFALEGLSESLGAELEPFGIHVMIVEPGAFRTDFAGRSIAQAATPHQDYPHLAQMRANMAKRDGQQEGDPVRGVHAIVDAMESDVPPRRLVIGKAAYQLVTNVLDERSKEAEKWRVLTESCDFPS